ncbi:MAG: c-type cytochrome [Bosea sp. (in: a-proteobacteria)]
MSVLKQHAGFGSVESAPVNSLARVARAILIAFGCATAGGTLAQAGDKAYGEYLASECAGCHRPTGPQVGGVRVIHGMDQEPFIKALKEYRDKTRANNVMQNVAGKLQDDDISALAAYYSSMPK